MLSISLLAMKLRGMRRSINISPLRGVLQPQTQSNQRDDFCSKAAYLCESVANHFACFAI
jgi:hypothetical protein